VRYGLYLPTQGAFADARLLAELARIAEDSGWDGVFLWDELLSIAPDVDPELRRGLGGSGGLETADTLIALTAIAGATQRIRFGPLVTALPRLRPEVLAHQTATLDHYSEGRLILGVGLGNPDLQFRAFGYPADPKVRAAMLDEFLDLVALLWTGEPVTFSGTYCRALDVSLAPGCLQRPRIPIWIGTDSRHRAPLRRAARWDGFAPVYGWPDHVIPPKRYRELTGYVAGHRTAEAPLDVVLMGNRDGTRPPPEAADEYAAAGVTWWLVQCLSAEDAAACVATGPPTA
jgi:alkanesulfonate monooxygenase SsuD/methylene tetrahydromethanopterin reductase-like flavin-dependent oxidoreductase (luciferase family)